ncbi:MAG: hypothetical protein WA919_29265 [Coleofasciculaceae cyanobacterium]
MLKEAPLRPTSLPTNSPQRGWKLKSLAVRSSLPRILYQLTPLNGDGNTI